LREEHETRWLKRNIVDRIHCDQSETLSATIDCVSRETPVDVRNGLDYSAQD